MSIKSRELEPNKDNLLATLKQDLLDRNKSVWQFARFCDEQEGKCSIAIDAKWGFGKTFFVKQTKLLIESFNQFTHVLSEEERISIKEAFRPYIGRGENEITLDNQVCVYYDAWSNDNDIDPMLSLVYSILEETASDYDFKKSVDCINTAAALIDTVTGRNVLDLSTIMKERDPLSRIKEQKEIHDLIEELLEYLLYEQGNRLVVFIDELDRCKPSYAIQLLERIKHYFANDRVTFVFSVNVEELQHAVKRYYGNEFDACRYLDRFFDYRIALPPANMTKYYQYIGLEGSYVFETVCSAVAKYCSFGLRELEKFYRIAKIAAYNPTHKRSFAGFPEGNAEEFSLVIFVPIIIGLRIANTEMYSDFIEGKNAQPLIDIMGGGNIGRGYCSTLLAGNEVYGERTSDHEQSVELRERLRDAYLALFSDEGKNDWNETVVGKCSFSNRLREKILRVSSMLSEHTSFE